MNSRAIYAVVAILAIVISAVDASGFGFGHSLDFVRTGSSSLSSGCEGSIAECIAEEEEMEFDSDISRRILAQKKYVSYGAMRKNSVPCSRRGASYYNCQRGAQANPYRRGCSTITRCRPVDASGFGFGHSLDFVRTGSSSLSSGCEGSIAECIAEEEEMEFDSDISRRILAQKKYVSYGAMRKNSVPCSRRGASYYNCQRGAQANPYRRGCSTITRCRR
ncbi:hypothetical protein F2Q68_00033174 [Brassica cretica]|uniref:Uncharacterized protein n=3 Tax=Brassica cretica TaxID=69181 RepID=A0A8S9GGI2_BRACR|nr:hypothetical protein F2Q68_00033174 [Brassica cretica]